MNKGGTDREKFRRISEYTSNILKSRTEVGSIIHDKDMQRWAPQAQTKIKLRGLYSRASC